MSDDKTVELRRGPTATRFAQTLDRPIIVQAQLMGGSVHERHPHSSVMALTSRGKVGLPPMEGP